MFKTSLLAALGAVAALLGSGAGPAHAQVMPGAAGNADSQAISEQNERRFGDRATTASPSARENRAARNRNGNRNQPAPPTPEENIAAAQAIATAASTSCQVTQANLLGVTTDQASMYEAACATGPGYILISTTPPQAVDCVLLAGQAELDRARDPAAAVGTQCVIPQNADVLRVVSAYASEAGVPCPVDQGASIGKARNGNLIYEVGCNGLDGFWIEKDAAGWTKTECAVVVTQNGTCRYSTPAEAVATLKARIVGSDAAACDATEGRYMGANANGAFWEAKCAAGNGVIVRFNTDFAVQQVYPCETAHRIGGGCTLTIVPPPAETPAAPAAPQ